MSIVEKIPEFLVPIYAAVEKDPSARRAFIVNSFGRFVEFKKTEQFLEDKQFMGIDIDKLNKKVESTDGFLSRQIGGVANHFSNKHFNNMVAKLLHDNPYADDILKDYIQNVETEKLTEKQIENRVDVIKNLNSISRLLKADPYNEPQFTKDVLAKVVSWGFEGIKEERGFEEQVKLLRKSLNCAANKGLIKDFISNDIVKQKNAEEVLELITVSEKAKDSKCTMLTSIAAFGSLGFASIKLADPETAKEIVDKISEGLKFAPHIAHSLIDTVQTTPMGHVLIAGIATFAGLKLINEAFKKVVEYKKEKQIRYADINEANHDSTVSLLTNNIISGVMLKSPYDLSDQKTKNYLVLSSFLVEKTKNPSLVVSFELKRDLSLSTAQAEKLNKLTQDDIHELYFVNNPSIKQYLLLNDVNEKEKQVFKKISLIQEVYEIDTNYDGKFFKPLSTINGISQKLNDKINSLSKTEKQMVESYLNLYREKNNDVSPSKLKFLEDNLLVHNVSYIIDNEVAKLKKNGFAKQEEKEKADPMLAYVKRLAKMPGALWDRYVAKTGEKEKIDIVNADVKDEMQKVNAKYGFTEAQKLNEKYISLISSTRKLKGNIKDRIDAIRSSSLHTPPGSNPLIP